MPSIRAELFDVDGVVRHFDPANVPSNEHPHGLRTGFLETIAFASHHLEQLTTVAILSP